MKGALFCYQSMGVGRMRTVLELLVAAVAFLSLPAFADDVSATLDVVPVQGIRNPQEIDFRNISRYVSKFMSVPASERDKVKLVHVVVGKQMRPLSQDALSALRLDVEAGDETWPVEIQPRGEVLFPQVPAEKVDEARIVSNVPKGSLTLSTRVRILPPAGELTFGYLRSAADQARVGWRRAAGGLAAMTVPRFTCVKFKFIEPQAISVDQNGREVWASSPARVIEVPLTIPGVTDGAVVHWKRDPADVNQWLQAEVVRNRGAGHGGATMSSLRAPSFGPWLPWLMARWPIAARELARMVIQYSASPWMSAYAPAVRSSLVAAQMYSPATEKAILRLPSEFLADTLFLQHATDEAVLAQDVRMTGFPLDDLLRLRAEGRGILLACSNFGCFYNSLLACRGVIDDLLIVTGGPVPDGEHRLKARLERLGGLKLRLLPVNSRSATAIARQLKGGGVVATMLDTCLPHSQTLVAPFLGRPAVSPAGIYQLVCRFNVHVLPMFCLRRSDHVEVELGRPIEGGGRAGHEVAADVNACIGAKILEEPGQWMMWPALLDRWRRAETASR
ncbi:MAG TPA: hypothetical protein VGD42_20405 [Lysobacter sp.]